MSTKLTVGSAPVLAIIASQAMAAARHHLNAQLRDGGCASRQLSLPPNTFGQDIQATTFQGRGVGAFPTDYLTNRFGDFQSKGR